MIKKPIPRSKIFNTRQPILRQMARRYTPTISISDRLDDISAILRRPTTGLLDITSNTQQAATDAHQAATDAKDAATNAFTQAQAAIDTANTAHQTANNANQTATNAQTTANTAKDAADNANTAITETNKKVTAVESIANAALPKADFNKTLADDTTFKQAQANITTAQTTANTAKDAANNANTAITETNKKVTAVESIANTAQQTANAAKSTADLALPASSFTQTNISEKLGSTYLKPTDSVFTTVKDNASTALSTANAAKDTADNLKFGKNILPRIDNILPNIYIATTLQDETLFGEKVWKNEKIALGTPPIMSQYGVNVKGGVSYTLSVYVKTLKHIKGEYQFRLSFYDYAQSKYLKNNIIYNELKEWTQLSVTYTPPADTNVAVMVYMGYAIGSECLASCFKLETGNRATAGYNVADNELENAINAAKSTADLALPTSKFNETLTTNEAFTTAQAAIVNAKDAADNANTAITETNKKVTAVESIANAALPKDSLIPTLTGKVPFLNQAGTDFADLTLKEKLRGPAGIRGYAGGLWVSVNYSILDQYRVSSGSAYINIENLIKDYGTYLIWDYSSLYPDLTTIKNATVHIQHNLGRDLPSRVINLIWDKDTPTESYQSLGLAVGHDYSFTPISRTIKGSCVAVIYATVSKLKC